MKIIPRILPRIPPRNCGNCGNCADGEHCIEARSNDISVMERHTLKILVSREKLLLSSNISNPSGKLLGESPPASTFDELAAGSARGLLS